MRKYREAWVPIAGLLPDGTAGIIAYARGRVFVCGLAATRPILRYWNTKYKYWNITHIASGLCIHGDVFRLRKWGQVTAYVDAVAKLADWSLPKRDLYEFTRNIPCFGAALNTIMRDITEGKNVEQGDDTQ